jgi:putative hydrolase of HD superfamily
MTISEDDVRTRLARQIEFILELDKLKSVSRRAVLFAEDRRENSAEHSWHVALMALVLAEHANEGVDRERVVKMLLVHDVVEIDAGDVPVYDVAARAARADAERLAAERLFGLLPDGPRAELRDLWDEYEEQQTAEARFARAMDRLMPLLHNAHGGGRTWRELGVVEAQVRETNRPIEAASSTLWRFVSELLDRAVEEGLLPRGSGSGR